MSESITLDNQDSTKIALGVLYAADQGVTASSLTAQYSLNQIADLGARVAAKRFAAHPDAIPDALLAALKSETWLTAALVRMVEDGADLSEIVAVVPEA